MERVSSIKLKWDITGKGDEAWGAGYTEYEGKPPPKGSYVVKLKRMTLGKIAKEGENKGKPRISVLVEVVGGSSSNGLNDKNYAYLGAPIWDGLNILKAQTGRVNGFLHALTDGSDAAKAAVETAFWPPNGPKAEKIEKNGNESIHITDIGKYHIGSPDGNLLMRVTTKMGKDLQGNPRAEVNTYLPYTGPKPEASANGQAENVAVGAIVEGDGDGEDEGELMDASAYLDSLSSDAGDLDTDVPNVDDEPPF